MTHPVLNTTEEVERLLKLSKTAEDVEFLVKNVPDTVLNKVILNLIDDLKDLVDRLNSYRSDSYRSDSYRSDSYR